MDIQKIVHEGNIKIARSGLARDYLGIALVGDIELIQLVLAKLEQQGSPFSTDDYEACQLLEILLDTYPLTDPLHTLFLTRLEAVRAYITTPLAHQRYLLPDLKVNT